MTDDDAPEEWRRLGQEFGLPLDMLEWALVVIGGWAGTEAGLVEALRKESQSELMDDPAAERFIGSARRLLAQDKPSATPPPTPR